MKKPEVVYVRSGYNPLRASQKPVEARGVLSSRAQEILVEVNNTSEQFDRCLKLAQANIAKHKAKRLAPPKVSLPKAVSKEPQKDATKEALRKKIDKLLRQNEKLRREIAQG